jgi:hypothetical protein
MRQSMGLESKKVERHEQAEKSLKLKGISNAPPKEGHLAGKNSHGS